jgi:sodium transport system permease protein
MIVGFTQLSIFMVVKMGSENFPMAIENPASAPNLVGLFESDTQLVIEKPLDPDSALIAGDIFVYVKIPPGFDERIASSIPESLTIKYNGAEERSEMARSRVSGIVSDFERQIVARRVMDAGLDSSVTNPIITDFSNVATEEKMGGMLFGRILAMILVLMVISGAYYSSIDMVAGEKERGTLETLLVSPVGRMEIVFGKYLTVFVLALVNALMNLASMGLTMSIGIKAMGNQLGEAMSFSLSPGTLALILIELLPLAALFSAVFLAVSSFAKSYKEAQGYLTPLFIIAELPAMAALLPGFDLTTVTAFIPVLNVALLIKRLMVGSVGFLNFTIVWLSTAVYAAATLRWAASIISNEEVLLSESAGSPLNRLFSRRDNSISKSKPEAGAVDAFLLFAVAVSLLWWIGAPLQSKDVVAGLLITEVLLVMAPAMLFARRLNLDFIKTFRIKKIDPISAIMVIPMGVAGFALITQFEVLFSKFVFIPTEYAQQFEVVLMEITALGPVGAFAVIALLPAVCEEILFRGYILDGLTRKWGASIGIVITGILFGAFHLDPFRMIPASLLGILFGIIVFRKGSIFYGIIAHLVNNGCALVTVLFAAKIGEGYMSGERFAPVWFIAVAVAVFGLSLWVILRNKNIKPIEVEAQL